MRFGLAKGRMGPGEVVGPVVAETHPRQGLLQAVLSSGGGRRLLFGNNLAGVMARCPRSLCMPVLAAGTEEQPAGDVAFAPLLPSTQGCLLHVRFLVQGTGYRFVDAQPE